MNRESEQEERLEGLAVHPSGCRELRWRLCRHRCLDARLRRRTLPDRAAKVSRLKTSGPGLVDQTDPPSSSLRPQRLRRKLHNDKVARGQSQEAEVDHASWTQRGASREPSVRETPNRHVGTRGGRGDRGDVGGDGRRRWIQFGHPAVEGPGRYSYSGPRQGKGRGRPGSPRARHRTRPCSRRASGGMRRSNSGRSNGTRSMQSRPRRSRFARC